MTGDCSETAGSSSAVIGCFPPVSEILQMPLGALEDTGGHLIFFQITCLMPYCQDIVTVL